MSSVIAFDFGEEESRPQVQHLQQYAASKQLRDSRGDLIPPQQLDSPLGNPPLDDEVVSDGSGESACTDDDAEDVAADHVDIATLQADVLFNHVCHLQRPILTILFSYWPPKRAYMQLKCNSVLMWNI